MSEAPEWESAPVTYDLDFHARIMAFLLHSGGREGLILADELNKRMGVSARKRQHSGIPHPRPGAQ